MLLCAVWARAAVPANVSFVAISTGSASLSWELDSAEEIPDMQLASDVAFSTIIYNSSGLQGATATTYYNLNANTTYYFKVKVSTESNYSAVVSSATDPAIPDIAVFNEVDTTKITAQWSPNTNGAATVYTVESAIDEGFTLNASVWSGTGTFAAFEGLNANSAYYFRGKAGGFSGHDSAYNNFGSTITHANPPSDEAYSLVSSTGMSIFWSHNINPSWTTYELIVSTDDFSTINYSTIIPGNYYNAAGLIPNTTYYFKAAGVNGAGTKSDYYVFGATLTYAAAPAENPPALGSPGVNSVSAQWLPNSNPTNLTQYFIVASTSSDFIGTDYGPGIWFTAPTYNVSGLASGIQYYFRVRARDQRGRLTDYLYLGSVTTLSGPDITPPSVIDLQGGDNTWRGPASPSYMVHFQDLDSHLDRFQVKVTTGPNFSGDIVADWSDVVTNINAETYNTDWQIPSGIFSLIAENVTSYISVRVYDKAAPQPNVTVSTDVFYVIRDTTPPNIINNSVSPSGWLTADPGAIFDVDFDDALSGLSQILYSASDQADTANANIWGWTPIDSFVSSASYTAQWAVAFSELADGASNYISVRATDLAGNTRPFNDAFRILKNMAGPAITILSPAGTYVSTLTAITGVSRARNESSPVASNEIALRDLTSPASYYYDGVSFSSASPVWLPASGLADWSYNSSTVPFSPAAQYRVFARSRDINSLITPEPYPNTIFQFDQVSPSVYLSTPVAVSTISDFNEISGTAADDVSGAGMAAVAIYIKRLYDSKWWDFSSGLWSSAEVSSDVPAGSDWNFTPDASLKGSLVHNQQYFVTVVAKDSAIPANKSAFGAVGSTFTLSDTIPPLTVTNFVASTGTSPKKIDLSWVVPGDDIGPLAMPSAWFAVQYDTSPAVVFSTLSKQVYYFTESVLPGSTHYYTVSVLSPDTTYYLTLWVCDDAGLWSGPSPVATAMSGESLNDMISGSVKTPSHEGVTGVLVEAIDVSKVTVSTSYTLDDNNGTFTLSGLPVGFYRVQATWVKNGFSSSIAKDQIPMGYAEIDFELSDIYLLASVSGFIPLSSQASVKTAGTGAGGSLQLWQGGRKIVSARSDAAGRFAIRNLIPGKYTLKVLSPAGGWKEFPVQLEAGQDLQISPLGSLIKKNSVYVYPNPSATLVRFHVETDISPVIKHLAVFSLDGSLVKEADSEDGGWTAAGANGHDYLWNFSAGKPASGIYFYSLKLKHPLTGETDKKTGKFAVVR